MAVRRIVLDGAPAVVCTASDPEARRRLALLGRCTRWAYEHDLAAPRILEESDARLVIEWYDHGPSQGVDYVDNALDVADRISTCPDAPPTAPRTWDASRRTALTRLARLVRGGVPIRDFLRFRAEASRLPGEVPAHNDFHDGNVLNVGDRVVVIDWEFLGIAPRCTDAARLWCTLARPEDRAHAADRLVDMASPDQYRDLGVLLRWHALRNLAQNLDESDKPRNEAALRVAREVLPESRAVARRLGVR